MIKLVFTIKEATAPDKERSMVAQGANIEYSKPTTAEFITCGLLLWLSQQGANGNVAEMMDKDALEVHSVVAAVIMEHLRNILNKENIGSADVVGLVAEGKVNSDVLMLLHAFSEAQKDPDSVDGLAWKQQFVSEETKNKYIQDHVIPELDQINTDKPDKINKDKRNNFKKDVI